MDTLVDGELALRPMRADDFATMARWLSDPRVLTWFGGRDRPMSLLDVTAKYQPRLAADSATTCLIAELDGVPVGYVQFYRWRDHATDASVLGLSTLDNPYGLDVFVGRPELWGTGLGSRMVRLLLGHLFGTVGARRVALAAMAHNYRAQRAYAKVGFRRVRLVPGAEVHEGVARDEWLMVADRGSYSRAEVGTA
ncbi:GNAT family N-acetyltransferase [Actinocatenispora rupis]|uniref:GNAT family N-acetyltransferase n=1 Tax=Actinocatenispora rupis TaxID=519421 RepID=A0A8J3J068_9ACTN|nr:GNAT family N-acetyltransferase [Actinocatenispora rupis]GID13361.1 GNAT family N-acetyltransferase [Actinocatenispora rupis]